MKLNQVSRFMIHDSNHNILLNLRDITVNDFGYGITQIWKVIPSHSQGMIDCKVT
jgi:hypothetical protein